MESIMYKVESIHDVYPFCDVYGIYKMESFFMYKVSLWNLSCLDS